MNNQTPNLRVIRLALRYAAEFARIQAACANIQQAACIGALSNEEPDPELLAEAEGFIFHLRIVADNLTNTAKEMSPNA